MIKKKLFAKILISVTFIAISLSIMVIKLENDRVRRNSKKNVISEIFPTAEDTLKAMKIGWNLGNTLDSYNTKKDAYEISNQFRDKYQLMATYSTQPYSAWDASNVPYFQKDTSICELNWRISSLKSTLKKPVGNFHFKKMVSFRSGRSFD